MTGSSTHGIKTVLHPVTDLAKATPVYAALLAEPAAEGATVKEPARQVGWGRVVATVTDPDGNVPGLLQDR